MSKFLLASIAAAVFALSSACATSADRADGSAVAAIAAAKEAQKKASGAGAEWRDTDKMIKEAEELAAAGKVEEAVKKAKKAEMQGNVAYTQITQTEAKATGPRF